MRHGQTYFNIWHKIQGWCDSPLTPEGIKQAQNAGKYFNDHPDHFDPRQYLKPARAAIKDMVAHKLVDVLGCDGKA